ncbi:hypothetical protein SLS62_000090 [Diatrype stigma]|uniref:L-lysine 2,3-aminomutase n=1 Tax=Diatrype stigma TaxID=117547 RepID=A0AAN9YWZ2_9PEZI
MDSTIGTSTTSKVDATEPDKLERQTEQEQVEHGFWRDIAPYKDISAEEFLSWRWCTKNVIETEDKLFTFLDAALPDEVLCYGSSTKMQSKDYFMADVLKGLKESAMSVRVMPYMMSKINWEDPANDPIFRQFIPLSSILEKDHPMSKYDSLHEKGDTAVSNLVHRYPDKALFLGKLDVHLNKMVRANPGCQDHFKLNKTKLKNVFAYIASQEGLHDIVVSGGDAFYLSPENLEWIGDMLISTPNIRRFRFASKGLAVAPQRFIDPADDWTNALIRVSNKARQAGKHMALHTHFNHPNEISWITEKASLRLLQAGVTVRNQTVLLRNINDNVATMSALIRKLADMVVQPYYIYQCDMTGRVEHFRTPLQTILDLEAQLRGSIAGFMMPNFVVDLPEGGGKRLACSFQSYDRESGVSSFTAPVLTAPDKAGKIYHYYDPVKTPVEEGKTPAEGKTSAEGKTPAEEKTPGETGT